MQVILLQVWPTLSLTFQKYSNDLRVMEHCCRCLRFAVRCVHQQSAPLLSPLVEQVGRKKFFSFNISLINVFLHLMVSGCCKVMFEYDIGVMFGCVSTLCRLCCLTIIML